MSFSRQDRSWCCQSFEAAVNQHQTGRRGHGIFITEPQGSLLPMGFFFGFRAIDASADVRASELEAAGLTFVCLGSSQGILFCPWCGTNLRSFYGNKTDLPFCAAP